MFAGIDNKNLNRKDRLSLLSRTQVMYINGRPISEIEQFARSFSEPREIEFPKVGGGLVSALAKMGWVMTLIALVVHNVTR